jgi:hypothetical protein
MIKPYRKIKQNYFSKASFRVCSSSLSCGDDTDEALVFLDELSIGFTKVVSIFLSGSLEPAVGLGVSFPSDVFRRVAEPEEADFDEGS